MNLGDIRQIIEESGGKVIIVENERPILVIERFEDYKKNKNFKKLEEFQRNPLSKKEMPKTKIEETFPEEEPSEDMVAQELPEELGIEDLPL